jgi:hypothetical protein
MRLVSISLSVVGALCLSGLSLHEARAGGEASAQGALVTPATMAAVPAVERERAYGRSGEPRYPEPRDGWSRREPPDWRDRQGGQDRRDWQTPRYRPYAYAPRQREGRYLLFYLPPEPAERRRYLARPYTRGERGYDQRSGTGLYVLPYRYIVPERLPQQAYRLGPGDPGAGARSDDGRGTDRGARSGR